jgi:hypothetical protein
MKHILQSVANWHRIVFHLKMALKQHQITADRSITWVKLVTETIIVQYISNILHCSFWKQILHFVVEYFRFTSWGAGNEMFNQNTQDVRANVSQFLLHLQGQWIYILAKKIQLQILGTSSSVMSFWEHLYKENIYHTYLFWCWKISYVTD